MKKTITLLACFTLSLSINAQSFTEDFEGFTLAVNSVYSNTNSVAFQGTSAIYEYKWDAGFSFWKGGFAYTNKYDSSTVGFGNLYGVKPLKGYNSSNIYVIGQDRGIIKLKAPYKGVEGFYLTNTTYAYKSMKLGDSFSKKFGGTTGNDPDFFKITVKGYSGGSLKTDSVEFYLADFRNANNALDYIVNSWQWLNTSSLGAIDSLKFFMYSSDVGSFGINTPLFFGLDNFTASPSFVGLNQFTLGNNISVYPNPVANSLHFNTISTSQFNAELINSNGTTIKKEQIHGSTQWDLNDYSPGIYFLKISNSSETYVKKLIKQ